MEINPILFWNGILTVVIAPAIWVFRSMFIEVKRLDILLNKTREEVARDYVTREQIEKEFQRILDSIDRIDQKIDRLQSKTYFQE